MGKKMCELCGKEPAAVRDLPADEWSNVVLFVSEGMLDGLEYRLANPS